jgi:hypothetical protein
VEQLPVHVFGQVHVKSFTPAVPYAQLPDARLGHDTEEPPLQLHRKRPGVDAMLVLVALVA